MTPKVKCYKQLSQLQKKKKKIEKHFGIKITFKNKTQYLVYFTARKQLDLNFNFLLWGSIYSFGVLKKEQKKKNKEKTVCISQYSKSLLIKNKKYFKKWCSYSRSVQGVCGEGEGELDDDDDDVDEE